jgi:TetR/AcrR family transcriptional regulator, tetracycline repressor protein
VNQRGPGQRAGLTRDAVLAAAADLIGDVGVAGLTMRALADRLGVRPNTLYSHVAGKDDLIDELLDAVLRAVPPAPPDAPDPAVALADVMAATFDVLQRHPDLVPAYLARQGSRGPVARALGESMQVQLERIGVPRQHRQEAVRVLVVHAIGFAAFAGGDQLSAPSLRRDFLTSLGWILDGLRAQRWPADDD